MTDLPGSAEAGTFFIAAIVLSLATWPFSFTLGAYGEVFYKDMLTVWVISIAALIAAAIIGHTNDGEVYFRWWGALLLLLPSAIMFSALLGLTGNFILIEVFEWLLLLVAIPYVGYVLLAVAAPETMELHSIKFKIGLAACIIFVNVSSIAVGHFNAYFFSCDDFIRAGDEAPKGCWRDPKSETIIRMQHKRSAYLNRTIRIAHPALL